MLDGERRGKIDPDYDKPKGSKGDSSFGGYDSYSDPSKNTQGSTEFNGDYSGTKGAQGGTDFEDYNNYSGSSKSLVSGPENIEYGSTKKSEGEIEGINDSNYSKKKSPNGFNLEEPVTDSYVAVKPKISRDPIENAMELGMNLKGSATEDGVDNESARKALAHYNAGNDPLNKSIYETPKSLEEITGSRSKIDLAFAKYADPEAISQNANVSLASNAIIAADSLYTNAVNEWNYISNISNQISKTKDPLKIASILKTALMGEGEINARHIAPHVKLGGGNVLEKAIGVVDKYTGAGASQVVKDFKDAVGLNDYPSTKKMYSTKYLGIDMSLNPNVALEPGDRKVPAGDPSTAGILSAIKERLKALRNSRGGSIIGSALNRFGAGAFLAWIDKEELDIKWKLNLVDKPAGLGRMTYTGYMMSEKDPIPAYPDEHVTSVQKNGEVYYSTTVPGEDEMDLETGLSATSLRIADRKREFNGTYRVRQNYSRIQHPYYDTIDVDSPEEVIRELQEKYKMCIGYKYLAGYELGSDHLWNIKLVRYEDSLVPPFPRSRFAVLEDGKNSYDEEKGCPKVKTLDLGLNCPVISYDLSMGSASSKSIDMINGMSMAIPMPFQYNMTINISIADDLYKSWYKYMVKYFNTMYNPVKNAVATYEYSCFRLELTLFRQGYQTNLSYRFIVIPTDFSNSVSGENEASANIVHIGFSIIGIENYNKSRTKTIAGDDYDYIWSDLQPHPVA